MTVKNTIHNLSKRIIARDKDSIDIEAAELSALALYKVYNLPYFNRSHEFLRMHKNIFNEISIGSLNLNNVKGVRNDCMDEFNVLFDKEDQTPNEVLIEKLIRSREEIKNLNTFKDFLTKSNTIKELKDVIEEYEKNDNFFMSKIILILGDEKRDSESIIKVLDSILEYKADDTMEEFEFENRTKRNLYRKSSVSDITDAIISNYELRSLLFGRTELSEVKEDTLSKLTGLNSCTLEELNSFKEDYPEVYEKSLYKILIEEKNRENIIMKIYDTNHFEKEKKSMLNRLNLEIKKETIEDLMEKYDNQLDLIIRNVIKKYPELKGDLASTNLEIEIRSFTGESDYYKMVDEVKKRSNLDIYETTWGREANYDVVKGLRIYHREWGHNGGTLVILKNGLEEVSILEGDLRDEFRVSSFYERVKIPLVKVNYFHDAGRGVTEENIKDMFRKFVEMTSDERPVLVYDIYDRHKRRYSEDKDEEEIFYKVITQMKKEYPDVIFYNDGYGLNCDTTFMRDVKGLMFEYHKENNLNIQELRKLDKKIEEFFKTDEFKKLENMEYFEKKEYMQNIIEKIINQKDNKLKVKI